LFFVGLVFFWVVGAKSQTINSVFSSHSDETGKQMPFAPSRSRPSCPLLPPPGLVPLTFSTYLLFAVSGSGILIVLVSFCNLRTFFFFWLVCVYLFSELVVFVTFTLYCTRILHKTNFSLPLPLSYLTHPCRLIEVAFFSGGDAPRGATSVRQPGCGAYTRVAPNMDGSFDGGFVIWRGGGKGIYGRGYMLVN